MTENIFNSLLAACGGGLLTLIVLLIKIVYQKFRNDALTLKALAHDSFFRYCRYLLAEDSVSEHELENLNYLYNGYKAQGLNGTGDKLFRAVMDKPMKVGD